MPATDLFHVTYAVATPAIGSPLLKLSIVVDIPNGKITGIANITQTTNPPLKFRADVWGTFSTVQPVPDAPPVNIVTLDGNPSGQYSMIAETFHFHGILSNDWKSGNASYRYYEGERWHTVENAIVTVTTESGERFDPYYPPIPLYGVSMQQAATSGDLSRMKALAGQAEQQLADTDIIKSELTKLNAEIAKLEGRA
jgi:hypothetical protein